MAVAMVNEKTELAQSYIVHARVILGSFNFLSINAKYIFQLHFNVKSFYREKRAARQEKP